MAQVTSRYKYPDEVERKVMEQHYYDMEARKQLEKKLTHLDDKVKDTVLQTETARQELFNLRSLNNSLQKKIEDEETDVKSLHTKLGSLKVKLGMANATLNTGNDDKEKLRASLNEVQVEVARLEERLTASTGDLDRLRDPANPESNMSIRKHVVSDKKEIKRLKGEIESETSLLKVDKETVETKDSKIKKLEKELGNIKGQLRECEQERTEAQNEEDFERKRKEELISEFHSLKIDRKSYDQRLKELKVKLGISIANQNVNSKFELKLKKEEKSLTKQLVQVEKKLREATGQLDVLKNQHKMSKTAQSINQYTQRNQQRNPPDRRVSLAQSGPGPIKFGSTISKDPSKTGPSSSTKGSMQSIPERLLASDGARNKPGRINGGKQKQLESGTKQENQKTARSTGGGSVGQSGSGSTRASVGTGNRRDGSTNDSVTPGRSTTTSKKSSGQLVPPQKSKGQKATPR